MGRKDREFGSLEIDKIPLSGRLDMQTATCRILVVDDFEPWRQLVCSVLQEQPDLQVVGEARDGLEAIQKATELKADLVLLDINIPKMNGLEAARLIHEAVPSAKILFVSQISDTAVIAAALNAGGFGYILKIDAGTELLAAIKAILRGENFESRASERLKRP